MPLPGIFTVLPPRGYVRPQDSGNSPWAAGHGPVYLAFDAMVSEAPEYTATPTQSLVENASTISDHVTRKPLKLTVQGIISDTPVGFVAGIKAAFAGTKPSQKAFQWLEKLFDDREPFDFVGGFRVYKSMVITSWQPTRSAETGDSLRFTCTMEQVVVVSTQTLIRRPRTKAAQSKTSHGGQPLKPLPPVTGTIVRDSFQSISPTMTTGGATAKLGAMF